MEADKILQEFVLYVKVGVADKVFDIVYDNLSFLIREDHALLNKVRSDIESSTYKQIIFELCFDAYYNNSTPVTMYSHIRESTNYTVEENTKKEYIRSFDKLKKHQDKVYESFGLDNDDISELHKNDAKSHLIYPHQKLQYEIMRMLKPLVYKLSEGKFSKNHNYSDMQAEKDLELIDAAYDMISKSEISYFEKCIQYYHLEAQYHIEMLYRFFKAANENDRPIKLLKEDILLFKQLLGEINYVDNTANHIIMGADTLADVYKIYPDELEKLINFIFEINKIRKLTVREFKVNNPFMYVADELMTCSESEDFFKNYIGMGQHIVDSKDYSKDINIKYFRKIY